MADAEDDEILREFVTESLELLDDLDRQFVALESDPGSRDRLGAIFRIVHTIKGTSGLLGFRQLERTTHAAENVLAKLRDGELQLTSEATSVLLRAADAARTMLQRVEATGAEGDLVYADVLSELQVILDGGPLSLAGPAPVAVPLEQAPASPPTDSPMPAPAGVAAPRPVTPPPRAESPATAPEEPDSARDGSVRVATGLLERLMNLVGELVLARNQVLQGSGRSSDAALIAATQRLNLITTELQEGVMKTRMQAIGSLWAKFPRILRDLAVVCGKQVRLERVGSDTELDRTVIEAIRDPLTHLVRNSVDHGIEPAAARVQSGKPAAGVIVFRAFHEGGMVNIEVSDDGGGIDLERVRRKAIERNLISAERAARLSDRETLQLLFLPGFSTAEQVSNVSGRGVGMDVVKTEVERIGGSVDIQSQLGTGTSIRIKIPLTLAIIPALIVRCQTERYAIPQINLVELVSAPASSIEYAHDAPVYRLRGQLLPLVFLRGVFGAAASRARHYSIVVLHADARVFGLVVDDIDDTQEIVVRPLGRELRGISTFAGATIMGDGRVALILDVFSIAMTLGMTAGCFRAAAPAVEEQAQAAGATRSLLMVDVGTERRMALPLDAVERLEEVRRERIERAGGAEVIQYGSQILRLVHLRELFGSGAPGLDQDTFQVVVHSRGGQALGLVVDRIADIVEERVTIDSSVRRRGVLGAAVLRGSVVEVLDVGEAWRILEAKRGGGAAETC